LNIFSGPDDVTVTTQWRHAAPQKFQNQNFPIKKNRS